MKVLHIAAATSTAGGGEKHVADCLRGMKERGIEVALLCPEGGDLSALAEELEIPLFHAPIDTGIAAPRTRLVREAIAAFNPDIVHAHGHRAALFARRADPRARERVVYTFHGIHVDKGLLSPAKLRLERLLAPRTARFVATCKADAAHALALRIAQADRLRTVYNGIPAPRAVVRGRFRTELGLAPETPLVLTVARISPPKNLPGLIRIFDRLCRLREEHGLPVPCLAMVCPGDDRQRASLRTAIEAADYGRCIRLLPRRDDLSTAYTNADVFVLASRWEARAYVLVEALSYRTPVVGYAIDGSAETVTSGVSGELVALGDEEAFATAIAELLDDPARARAYGAAGAQFVLEHFTLDAMLDGLLAVYGELCSCYTD